MNESAIVVSSEPAEPSHADRAKLVVYAQEAPEALAMRLVTSERELDSLNATIRALLLKEQVEISEAVEDRKLMAEKLGNLLKGNVSRVAHMRVLEELSASRREIAALKGSSPLQQENLELKRRIEVLELRIGGKEGEALAKERGYAKLQDVERGEGERIRAARARAQQQANEYPTESHEDE